jgi:methylisocitrate lyase
VRLVIHPVSALLAAAGAAHEIYAGLRDSAPPNGTAGLTWDQLNELLGLPQALEHERRFATNQPEGNPS